MPLRWIPLAVLFTAFVTGAALWNWPRRQAAEPRMEAPTFAAIRHQLALEVSKDRLTVDEPFTITVRFKNIDKAELPVTKWTTQKGRTQAAFFVSIGSASFGILPDSPMTGPSQEYELRHFDEKSAQDYAVVHHLLSDQVDVTRWQGTLRQLAGVGPETFPFAGDVYMRVTYLGEPNAVNSEWIKLQITP